MEIALKYGTNPHQKVARVTCDGPCPLEIVSGAPSYINILDALRGWQLVRDLKRSTGKAGAASFKHVSPAGAAVASDLSWPLRQAAFIEPEAELSPVAAAYAKARSSDRPASFGDFVAVSERVDLTLASLLKAEVSDGIIAPSYDQDALDVLKAKKGGKYVILRMDPDYQPPAMEMRRDFGLTLEQSYNDVVIDASLLRNVVTDSKDLPESVVETAIVTSVALKHTQSNSVAIGYEGHAIGIGAGQQSRIACTRLCCEKAERWLLKMHPKTLALHFTDGIKRAEATNLVEMFVRYDELDAVETAQLRAGLKYPPEPISDEERREWLSQFGGLVCSSDAFFPFRDNIDRLAQTGVRYVIQAGGSTRDDDVIDAANEHGIVMAFTGLRLFLH